MTCDQIRLDLGAYVLGALDPAERMEVDNHVAHCADCRSELSELAELPALLGRLSEREAAEGLEEPPPPNLLPDLLTRVSAERRRRRARLLVAAAASVVVAVSGVAFAATQVLGNEAPLTVVTASAGGVETSADLRAASGGTDIALHIAGVPAGQQCRLVSVDAGGGQRVLSEWQANYQGTATIDTHAPTEPHQIRTLAVVTPEGRHLADLQVPQRS